MTENEVVGAEEILEPDKIEEEPDLESAEAPTEPVSTGEEPDYAALVEEDLELLRRTFPEMAGARSISELENPLRYAALRDLGLSPKEAYLATTERSIRRDNRSHLVGATPRGGSTMPTLMSREEMRAARSLFDGMSDAEIQSLYKKVTFRN